MCFQGGGHIDSVRTDHSSRQIRDIHATAVACVPGNGGMCSCCTKVRALELNEKVISPCQFTTEAWHEVPCDVLLYLEFNQIATGGAGGIVPCSSCSDLIEFKIKQSYRL